MLDTELKSLPRMIAGNAEPLPNIDDQRSGAAFDRLKSRMRTSLSVRALIEPLLEPVVSVGLVIERRHFAIA